MPIKRRCELCLLPCDTSIEFAFAIQLVDGPGLVHFACAVPVLQAACHPGRVIRMIEDDLSGLSREGIALLDRIYTRLGGCNADAGWNFVDVRDLRDAFHIIEHIFYIYTRR